MTTKIITTSRYKKNFETISIVLLVIVLMLTIGFRNINTISFYKENLSDKVGYIVLITYLILIIATIILYYFSRKRKSIGKLTMTSELIEIETINQKLEYKISELDNFKVDSKFLRTKIGTANLISSIDNWILFDFGDHTFRYQFPITSEYVGNRFRELIVDWSKNDNFSLINEK